jgi:hypothetical protein
MAKCKSPSALECKQKPLGVINNKKGKRKKKKAETTT